MALRRAQPRTYWLSVVGRGLKPANQLGHTHAEPLGKDLECGQADILFAAFHVGDVAAVNPQSIGHLYLRPALRLAEFPQAYTEPGSDSSVGHTPMLLVVFER